jgi:Homeodomain-like domain
VRSAEQFDAARRLIAAGVNDCAVARQLGVPRPTIRDWRCRPQIRSRLVSGSDCRISVRYHFSNRSDDIRGLFTAALDQLGIPWTRPIKYVIAVYRKAAVARLDEFVGPKS